MIGLFRFIVFDGLNFLFEELFLKVVLLFLELFGISFFFLYGFSGFLLLRFLLIFFMFLFLFIGFNDLDFGRLFLFIGVLL